MLYGSYISLFFSFPFVGVELRNGSVNFTVSQLLPDVVFVRVVALFLHFHLHLHSNCVVFFLLVDHHAPIEYGPIFILYHFILFIFGLLGLLPLF